MNSKSLQHEMDKNPSLKEEAIKQLQEWHETQSHLPKVYDSDFALFLHSNNYNIEETKVHIENYYTARSHLPEFFASRDPYNNEALKKAFDTVSVIPLEKRTKEGYKVILARLIDTDAENYVYNDAVKYFNMALDISIYEEGTNDGYVAIFDLNGANMKHCARLTPQGLKNFFLYMNNGAPMRWHGLHYVNTAKVFDQIQNFVKTNIINNMSADSFQKLYLHSSLEKLAQIVPIEILPNEMGGKAGPILALHKAEIKKLESYRDWFSKSESRHKVDEKKRVVDAGYDARRMFEGEVGDFKNLEID